MNALPFAEAIRKPITTLAEAVAFFEVLVREEKHFHPEDSAHEIVNTKTNRPLFSRGDADKLDDRISEAYTLDWPSFCSCPCACVMLLDRVNYQTPDEDKVAFDAWREVGCPSLPTDMRATVAQIDGVGDKFDCFTQGKIWNGWLDVFMTPAQLAKFMDGDAIAEYRKATDDPLDLTPDAETGLISMNGFCFVEAEEMEVAP